MRFIAAGSFTPTYDFGFIIPASLGNYVWYDTNNDGIQDAGESGVVSVTVTLKNAAGTTISTTQTNAAGLYLFPNLQPGDYYVVFSNLPSGYHRDMQLLKELLMPAFEEILDCLDITHFMLEHLQVKPNLLADTKYDLLFSVERVNELVVQGVPFRDAYRQVGKEINENTYHASRDLKHTHEGSIGNLCNDQIVGLMESEMHRFGFEKVHGAVERLMK